MGAGGPKWESMLPFSGVLPRVDSPLEPGTHMKPTRLEAIEFTLILLLLPLFWWLSNQYPIQVPLGKLIGFVAALLLSQSLFRDLVLWWQKRKSDTPKRRIGCLCAESTIGLSLAGAAIAMSLLGLQQEVRLSPTQATALAGTILAVGFFTKNYVVIIRKEKDHGSIRVW